MKCEYCSGNLSLESKRCPHCDAENPFYKAHREDMAAYAKRYAATQEAVVKKANRFTKNTFGITISAVLVAIIAIMIVVLINIDDINYDRLQKANTKNAAKIAEYVGTLEDNKDYMAMGLYSSSLIMRTYGNEMAEYNYVLDVARSYYYLCERMNRIVLDNYKASSAVDDAKSMGRNLDILYDTRYVTYEKKNMYAVDNGPAYFSDKHLASMDDMINNINVMLITYLGFDKETLDTFKDISSTERQLLLEKKLKEVAADEE